MRPIFLLTPGKAPAPSTGGRRRSRSSPVLASAMAAMVLLGACNADLTDPAVLRPGASARSYTGGPVCPSVGSNTDCGTIITFSDAGVTIATTGQGPYDDVEDTQIGVINNSSRAISSIGITSGATVFGFDGDGVVAYGVPGNAMDGSGYGGPNAYFTDINASLTGGTVRFITPIAAKGGTSFFSLEERVGNAYSCKQIIDGAVKPKASGANIDATFTPNFGLTLPQAAQFCNFADFNWQQQITHQDDPSAFFARNLGGLFRSSVVGPVNLGSKQTPYSDPPQGGGYTYSAAPDFSFPFYYNTATELPGHKSGNTLTFHDAPADPCMPGGGGAGTAACAGKTEPVGAYGGYATQLAGVNADGSATNLKIGFKWRSNYNGHTGGAYIKKTDLLADGDGTGGVTVTEEQTTTDYDYNGIGVGTVNGDPVGGAIPPTITSLSVSPDVIWPPNHRMVPVTVAVVATDGSAAGPVCAISDVSSNEPSSTPQWAITGALTATVLAERSGGGTGRVYNIVVTCTGASGLAATGTVTVSVPHDQRN